MKCLFTKNNKHRKYLKSKHKFDIIKEEGNENLYHETFDCLNKKGEILIWKEYNIPDHIKKDILKKKINSLKNKLRTFYKHKKTFTFFPSEYKDIFRYNNKLIIIRKKIEDYNDLPIFYGSKSIIIKQLLERMYILNYYKFRHINLKIKNFIWKEDLLIINDYIDVKYLLQETDENNTEDFYIKKNLKQIIAIIDDFIYQFQNLEQNREDILFLKDLKKKCEDELFKEKSENLRVFQNKIDNFRFPIIADNLLFN